MLWSLDDVVEHDGEIVGRFKSVGRLTTTGKIVRFIRGVLGTVPTRYLNEVECYEAVQMYESGRGCPHWDGGPNLGPNGRQWNRNEIITAHEFIQKHKKAHELPLETPPLDDD